MRFFILNEQFKQARKMFNSLKRQANPKKADILALIAVLTDISLTLFPKKLVDLEAAATTAFEEDHDDLVAKVIAFAEAKLDYVKTVELPCIKKMDVIEQLVDKAVADACGDDGDEDCVEVLEG